MQVAALKILATVLGKDSKSLCYVYEEHGVSKLTIYGKSYCICDQI